MSIHLMVIRIVLSVLAMSVICTIWLVQTEAAQSEETECETAEQESGAGTAMNRVFFGSVICMLSPYFFKLIGLVSLQNPGGMSPPQRKMGETRGGLSYSNAESRMNSP